MITLSRRMALMSGASALMFPALANGESCRIRILLGLDLSHSVRQTFINLDGKPVSLNRLLTYGVATYLRSLPQLLSNADDAWVSVLGWGGAGLTVPLVSWTRVTGASLEREARDIEGVEAALAGSAPCSAVEECVGYFADAPNAGDSALQILQLITDADASLDVDDSPASQARLRADQENVAVHSIVLAPSGRLRVTEGTGVPASAVTDLAWFTPKGGPSPIAVGILRILDRFGVIQTPADDLDLAAVLAGEFQDGVCLMS